MCARCERCAIAAALASVAGSLYAHYVTFVSAGPRGDGLEGADRVTDRGDVVDEPLGGSPGAAAGCGGLGTALREFLPVVASGDSLLADDRTTLDVASQASGNYLLRITDGDGIPAKTFQLILTK